MKKILSIIIPSYNMEAYLPQCLDSLLVENLDAVEVFVVNDGSKDKTLEIAKSYSSRFPDSIKVIDKPNGNYGSCINAALKVASGKYVKVLDADDSFEKGNFSIFIEFLKDVDVDLVVSDFVMVDGDGNVSSRIIFREYPSKDGILFSDCVEMLSEERFQMHAVTYRRDIFNRINYKQIEGISYTDQQWLFDPMAEVKTVAFFNSIVYRYLVGREGQTVSQSVSFKSLDQTIKVEKCLLEKYADILNSLDKPHSAYLKARLLQKLPTIYRIGLLKTDDEEIRAVLSDFDNEFSLLNPTLYAELNLDRFAGIPLPYIKYWRNCKKKGKKAVLLSFVRKILVMFYN